MERESTKRKEGMKYIQRRTAKKSNWLCKNLAPAVLVLGLQRNQTLWLAARLVTHPQTRTRARRCGRTRRRWQQRKMKTPEIGTMMMMIVVL